jgi:hypothetical protein
MKRYPFTSRIWAVALGLACHSIWLVGAGAVAAQTRAAGEISAARQASVNGVTVRASGTTIFSNSRVTTGDRGSAAISLGRRGRVELGARTELLLQFGSGTVGGELRAGRLVLSVPAGVQLSLITAKGLLKADGLQPTVLTIEAAAEKTTVVAHLGEAKLLAGGKTELIGTGEEVSLGSSTRGENVARHRVLAASLAGAGGVAGATGAVSTAQVAGRTATSASLAAKPTTLSSLLSTGLNFSLAQLVNSNPRNPETYFDATIVCRDTENFLCKRRSGVTP